jgi:hypothetical protein
LCSQEVLVYLEEFLLLNLSQRPSVGSMWNCIPGGGQAAKPLFQTENCVKIGAFTVTRKVTVRV